jgi:hypothetical protein
MVLETAEGEKRTQRNGCEYRRNKGSPCVREPLLHNGVGMTTKKGVTEIPGQNPAPKNNLSTRNTSDRQPKVGLDEKRMDKPLAFKH